MTKFYSRKDFVFSRISTILFTIGGIISVYRESYTSWRMFSNEDIALAEFVKTIEEIGLDNINIISADHDLADQHYSSGHVIDYSSYTTTYIIVEYLKF